MSVNNILELAKERYRSKVLSHLKSLKPRERDLAIKGISLVEEVRSEEDIGNDYIFSNENERDEYEKWANILDNMYKEISKEIKESKKFSKDIENIVLE